MADDIQKAKKALRNPKTLGVIVLNVGDGDSIVVKLPRAFSGESSGAGGANVAAVVDCYDGGKTIAALEALGTDEVAFICATHPHYDHIKGLKEVVRWCAGRSIPIGQFWDSGFRHVSKTHHDLIKELEGLDATQIIRPTSGFEQTINRVRVLVLSPSILLRNRYDTFGTNINNASVVIKLDYPAGALAEAFAAPKAEDISEQQARKQNTVILGGDAQFSAWGRITEEFPELVATTNRYQLIDPKQKHHRPLRCQVLKAPHHMSKHGITLEVLETLRPSFTIASCGDTSRHGFPHAITVLAAEDLKKSNKDKGLRYTGHKEKEKRGGTIVAAMRGTGSRPAIYCLGEKKGEPAPL